MKRLIRNFLISFGIALVGIPVLLGAYGHFTGEALFREVVRAFFTYFLRINVLASLTVAVVVTVITAVVSWVARRLRPPAKSQE